MIEINDVLDAIRKNIEKWKEDGISVEEKLKWYGFSFKEDLKTEKDKNI